MYPMRRKCLGGAAASVESWPSRRHADALLSRQFRLLLLKGWKEWVKRMGFYSVVSIGALESETRPLLTSPKRECTRHCLGELSGKVRVDLCTIDRLLGIPVSFCPDVET